MIRGRIQIGDIVTGRAGGEQWIVTHVRGPRIEIMRDRTDSRGVNWIERREVTRRDVVVVGSQIPLGLSTETGV
jgi:hypothetical protein